MIHKFWIDRGGTFTDCIFQDRETQSLKVLKLLSSDDAPIVAIRQFLNLKEYEEIPPCEVRIGTTLVTNALLERKGERVALIVTQGFSDILQIGTQARPDLFALNIEKAATLAALTFEIPLRADAAGTLTSQLTAAELEHLINQLIQAKVESVALSIVFGFMNPEAEENLAKIISDRLQVPVYCGSSTSKQSGFLARTATCALNAYLTPPLTRYLNSIQSQLQNSRLLVMQSNGQLAPPERITGDLTLLSGPAGGVVAAVDHQNKISKPAIAFDMGGTSTDVAWIEGQPPLIYETEIGGTPIKSTVVDIHTVAAGGGSLCNESHNQLTVGPLSAGAVPGPICYQRGNRHQLTLTDIQLYLGRIKDTYFPLPLGLEEVTQRLTELACKRSTDPRNLALQYLQIAIVKMAEAARQVSSAQGRSVENAQLLVYGGAGGQVACGVANELNLAEVFLPRLAGVYSAVGIGLAPESITEEIPWPPELQFKDAKEQVLKELSQVEEALTIRLRTSLAAHQTQRAVSQLRVSARYQGSHFALMLNCPPKTIGSLHFFSNEQELRTKFEEQFLDRFGFTSKTKLQIILVQLEISLPLTPLALTSQTLESKMRAKLQEPQWLTESGGQRVEAKLFDIDQAEAHQIILGPALLINQTGTVVLESAWQAAILPDGLLLKRKVQPRQKVHDDAFMPIMAARFTSVATQMGHALQRSAQSTNIRERLDFSCAVFGPDGALLANAPHIPVHLGAMSESVQAVLKARAPLKPGQSFLSNDPSQGGSHLPDITLVSPVFDEHNKLRFFTACRGHHSDVGGITPGSMPPFSTSLREEGVVFNAMEAISNGRFLEDKIREVLNSGPYPSRKPDEVIADLKAQLAANQLGKRLLLSFQKKEGSERIERSMLQLRRRAAQRVEAALQKLALQPCSFEDTLDDGSIIKVALIMRGKRMLIDFSGTAASHKGNLNAPKAVTIAAVLYFLRLLVGEDLPLNQGCLDPIDLVIPENSLLNPPEGAAVVAGNVETSQRVVDVLLGASGLAAASQGTMNNLSFGDKKSGYYETIAGGAGATSTKSGASAVHTHMTNTRITDPEELELNFPMRLEQFSIRHDSGGKGLYSGGNGIVRRFTVLAPMTLSIMSQRRTTAPFGLNGASPGARGINLVNDKPQGNNLSKNLQEGDEVSIHTPGGGGFGTP